MNQNQNKKPFTSVVLDKMRNSSWVGRIAVALLTFLAIRIFLPEGQSIQSTGFARSDQKIVIIPTAGIPSAFLNALRTRLEHQHGVGVLVSTEMGLSREDELAATGQYSAHSLAAHGLPILQSLHRTGAYGIVLTNRDINYPDSGLRFVFSAHYEGLSVVSLARVNPANTGIILNLVTVPVVFETTMRRGLKLVNKAIGRGYYGYPSSGNRESVMYGPIMSLEDLDSVGDGYTDKETSNGTSGGDWKESGMGSAGGSPTPAHL